MKKFNTANPGATPGGSFSAANADITDPFKKSNGRLSTPPICTWWWNRWFLALEPEDWTLLNTSEEIPHWCHPDGRCFNASLDPWRTNPDSEDGWQAFDDANGKGTWWWNKHTEDWFLESEPGDWMAITDPLNNQLYWYHKDGRYFCASLEPWLIEEQCDDD